MWGPCNQSQPSGAGMLGLIANNFVRVYHAYPSDNPPVNGPGPPAATGTAPADRWLAASTRALLAISHSFIVDRYDCRPATRWGP